MFSWIGKDDRKRKEPEIYDNVSDGLKKLYKQKLLPLEEHYKFHEFHSPALDDPDFDAKPMVNIPILPILPGTFASKSYGPSLHHTSL